MSSNFWLAIFMIAVFIAAIIGIVTNPANRNDPS
jgi:hypothetical protein